MISLRDRSNASKHCLFVIIASSHITNDVSISSSARIVPRLMSQIDVSSISSGILNLECVVLPFGSNNDATPDDATARTIFFEL